MNRTDIPRFSKQTGIHYTYRNRYVCAHNARELKAGCARIDADIVRESMHVARLEYEERMSVIWREKDTYYGACYESSMDAIRDAYNEYRACESWD